MGIGKEIGEFSIKSTTVNYPEDGGGVSLNCEGTATNYGAVLGTLTFRGEPGAKSGSLSWRGQGFLENGETVVENKVGPADINATIGYALGIPLDQVLYSPSKRPFTAAHKGQPIFDLFA